MSPTVSHKDNSRQRRPGAFNHSPDMKSGPLPPGGWEDRPQEAAGGEGDKEALLVRDAGPGELPRPPRGCRAELSSILLLLFLYVLQGIPLGLAGSIPLILQSKNVSYTDQAFFSLVFWPFSLKLLWAPLVDAVYLRSFGRRKSWLVPTQYTLGLFMIYLSGQVERLLGGAGGRGPDVTALTVTFFLFEFLAATQDIAVDGWALTMLSRENVGYASTCNSVGQTAGYFLGNVLFLALESADFCNKYLRFEPQPRGIVTLSDWFFSSRCSNRTEIGRRGSTQRTFSLTGSSNGSFADNIAFDYQQVHCRSPATKHILQSHALQVTLYSMYVSIMAFNAKVSDPLIGGTYMTLLNTVSNLGGNWPSTVALWLVDPLTVKECVGASNQNCRTPDAVELCKKLGGSCVTALDGYYVESIICVFIGFAWWFVLGPKLKKLQDKGPSSWKCKRSN
ncbi:acetyl-coenzyme A transporter 1 isoform X2 [Canis lupus baileyi]|uniref:Solute carrier family 33 member 1 n=2 Tax=Canis lupus familiaris TaxID=9615 RepID=A0A8C0T7K0_CANLF|nr:acetyl-coenzyme A transporter 1 isoform X2 [Canis lupus dingo]XP_038288656.1 acetyl-coenzyme A transporter 1 isoform X2 [Canis lupus familiaris]XP_038313146.1 acetyl-coenzyme A transporter 1 isoform X2 [Canis lupus familiaris]XP_038427205.1 acetyl-coenzyme A transporter 1 isoform X2 [Canis lupus familiaris]